MPRVIVSAPGKLMLFGEHAVLHGSGCLVTAVDQRMKATAEFTNTSSFELQAPNVQITDYKKPISEVGKGDIPKAAKFVEIALKNFSSLVKLNGIKISTFSEFSSQFGFGSSSAVTVCVVKALGELFKIKLTDKELFDLAYKTVLDVQKKGSGFDVAAAIYGGILYFESAGKVIKPFSIKSLPLVVGYSGIKADTVTIINRVSKNTKVFEEIAKVVNDAKKGLEKRDWKRVGELMNQNQKLLSLLGVSTEKLDKMIEAALSKGAYGGKLSGAGGGDCMIALVSDEKRKEVENAITTVGGEVMHVKVNAEGVRVEL